MPRPRPQLSITLPRNFTFHYTEGEEPKTPEREIPVPVARPPQRAANANAYRIKRRSRPAVTALFQQAPDPVVSSPIPTIETSLSVEPSRPIFQQRATEPAQYAPVARKYMTLPRTPILPQRQLTSDWDSSLQDIGDSISRPMSACSLISDSSDYDSNGSLLSFPTGGGSCTSVESDATDPFRFSSIKKNEAKQWAGLARNAKEIEGGLNPRQSDARWTSEMDKHLWSTYLIYLQDPTVTPFKMLPGTAPPLGVCHRVAREARRSWKKTTSRKSSELLSPPISSANGTSRADSPETIRAERSGSNTPTAPTKAFSSWPKSGSSTRRRLRLLCRSKPTIAPHYQRLMKSRSPSPFSSPRTRSRCQSRLSEVSSPIQHSSSFNTRDIRLSLTTSTADTMQPDGPLAQLASVPQQTPQSTEWFNEAPAPWASTPAIPSDVDIDTNNDTPADGHSSSYAQPLGSPFGHHTWGPSRSRQRTRPSAARIHSSDASTLGPSFLGPSLRSPVRMNDALPYSGVQKRRARHPLEDELSPGGSNMQQELLDNLFGSRPGSRHRRVRSRGFSLGDVTTPNPLASLFAPPTTANQTMNTQTPNNFSDSTGLQPPTTPSHIRRLGSPFHGISPRPPRTPSRHMATTSLGSFESLPFSSIGETLGRVEGSDALRGHLYR